MKKAFVKLIVLLLLAAPGNAQNLADSNVAGTWKVVNFYLRTEGLSKEQESLAETFKESFLKARFEFKADKHFVVTGDALDRFDIKLEDGHWKYDAERGSAVIQEWKDRDTDKAILIEIDIKRKDDTILFFLTETPFILEVEKED